MPLAEARYDIVAQVGTGTSQRHVKIVVDMLEERDAAEDGSPGRLRAAKLKSYEAPDRMRVSYERLALSGGARWFLVLEGYPRRSFVAKDRRYLRWAE